jgi:hypothetical protein
LLAFLPNALAALATAGWSAIVKLDIEGAEYAVLEDALNHGILDHRVAGLFVDFHGDRLTDVSVDRHNALVERLLDRGFALPKWSVHDRSLAPCGPRWLRSKAS